MEAINIRNDAIEYLTKLKEKNPEDYNNILRQEINELEMNKEMKERDKRDKELKLEKLKSSGGEYMKKANEIQHKIIELQKELHWMDAQASKALKNQFEMDKLLQSELHTYILSKKYEQIKRLLGRFRARSKKRSGSSACLVIRFLENIERVKDNQKMPYLVSTDKYM